VCSSDLFSNKTVATSAIPIGIPWCPDAAACTASAAKILIAEEFLQCLGCLDFISDLFTMGSKQIKVYVTGRISVYGRSRLQTLINYYFYAIL
jgi:hypothetical protein